MKKTNYHIGIVSAGAYVPPLLDSINDYGSHSYFVTAQSLGVGNRSAKTQSEDTVTLATNASQIAFLRTNVDKSLVHSLYLGTETPTYRVGNNAASVADFLQLPHKNFRSATLEFACRAGTLALIQAINETQIYDGVSCAVAADVATGAPDDILSLTGGIGGSCCILGGESLQSQWIAGVLEISSYTNRTSDFWKGNDESFPRHAGRYSSETYLRTLETNLNNFFDQSVSIPSDYDHVILHQPNQKLPNRLAKKFGFTSQQLSTGMIFGETGNLYSAMVTTAFVQVLEEAEPGQKILLASYGSGAGSDVVTWQVTDQILDWKNSMESLSLSSQIIRRNATR